MSLKAGDEHPKKMTAAQAANPTSDGPNEVAINWQQRRIFLLHTVSRLWNRINKLEDSLTRCNDTWEQVSFTINSELRRPFSCVCCVLLCPFFVLKRMPEPCDQLVAGRKPLKTIRHYCSAFSLCVWMCSAISASSEWETRTWMSRNDSESVSQAPFF